MAIISVIQTHRASGNITLAALTGTLHRVTNTGVAAITVTMTGGSTFSLDSGKTAEFWYDSAWHVDGASFTGTADLSTDVTLSENSDSLVCSEKALRAYIEQVVIDNVSITGDSVLTPDANHYIVAGALVTLTLPAIASKGSMIRIVDVTGYGFKLKRSSSSSGKMNIYNVTLPASKLNEYIQSNVTYTGITLICTTADADWQEITTHDITTVRGKGYCMGGYTTAAVNVIEDMNFATEASVAIAATLDTAKYGGCGVSGSAKGYCMGGYTTTYVAVIEDLSFSAETSAAISATLDTAKRYCAGVSGSAKGYCMGGELPASSNVIEDFIFIAETSAVIAATLDAAKYGSAGVSGISKGYCMGGYTTTHVATIEDLNFSTEASVAISATLDTAKYFGMGVYGNNKGYFMGGSTGSNVAVIEDLNFTDETSAVITATLDTAKRQGCGVSGSSKGYCMGGTTGSNVAVIEDLNFNDETSVVITATLNTAKFLGTGVQGVIA